MGVFSIQNDFTHGALSENMIGRSDVDIYKKSARRLRNVLVLPQGGVKRRFGTEFVTIITTNENEYKLGAFQFSEDEQYLLVFVNSGIQIYLDDILVATVITPWSGSDLNQLKFSQATNLMVFAHPDFQPRQLSRGVDSFTWNFGLIDFSYIPPHDFLRNYNSQSFTLSSIDLGNATLTVTVGSFEFTEAFVGGVFVAAGATTAEPLGFARIIGFTNSNEVNVEITVPFQGAAPKTFSGKDVTVAEKAWGDLESDDSGDRGWPKTVTFFGSRMWFGGSRSLPQNLNGSSVGDFIDFETGTGLDNQAIIQELASNKINDIKHLISDRGLQIFTFSSEWTPPHSSNLPLTPGNISILKQTNRGSLDVEPQVLDNVTFYVKRGGRGVMSYGFNLSDESYNSDDVSIVSSDLIRNPIDSAVLSGTFSGDANFLLLCNEDGTLATYQSLRSQSVSAWSISDTVTRRLTEIGETIDTPAKFKRVTTVGDDLYFIVERIIDGNIVNYIEKGSFDLFTDSTIITNSLDPIIDLVGLDSLEGQLVQVTADGFIQKDKTVVNGQITLDEPAFNIKVGLGYKWEIEMLPVTETSQLGPATFIPKRINRAFIRFIDSLGITINGQLVENLQFGDTFTENTLLVTSPPQSGVQTKRIQGWDIDWEIIISGDRPLPATILSIGYEVTT